MSVTIDLPDGLLASVFHVPEPEVPRDASRTFDEAAKGSLRSRSAERKSKELS
jgi:hypothetical protein